MTAAGARLLRTIEVWCDRTGTDERWLGARLFNHPGYVGLLRKRLDVTPKKAAEIRAFIRARANRHGIGPPPPIPHPRRGRPMIAPPPPPLPPGAPSLAWFLVPRAIAAALDDLFPPPATHSSTRSSQ